jgi:hypothetical protein
VHRRADSCNLASDYMRHCVRRSWREWEKNGASVQTLQWTRERVPIKSNGKPIHKPVETAYLNTDDSGYGRGAVLNEHLEARGLRSAEDKQQHIAWKERKAVCHAVENFLPQVACRNVVMHECNKALCHILTCLNSRSHVMMEEKRRLWCLLDTININLRACYIRSAANVLADKLSRHLDNDDWRLDPVLFAELDARFGRRSISSLQRSTPYYRDTTQDGETWRAKRWTRSTYHTTDGAMKTNGATPVALLTQPHPKATAHRRSGYNSRPPKDMKSMAPSAYRDGFRRIDRYAPCNRVPTRASGATR